MMHGDYRKLLARPEDLKAAVCQFAEKDQDILAAFEEVELAAARHGAGPHSALLLQFSLQKSSYATMLIREFCHISSSFEMQELINQAAEEEPEKEDPEKEEPAQH